MLQKKELGTTLTTWFDVLCCVKELSPKERYEIRYQHSVRSHPECDGVYNDYGAMHKWQKRLIHKGIRKYYKNKKWLRGAIADTDGLNPSQLRVQLPS